MTIWHWLVLLASASITSSRLTSDRVCVLVEPNLDLNHKAFLQLLSDASLQVHEATVEDVMRDNFCINLVLLDPSLLDPTGELIGHIEHKLDQGHNILVLTNSSISTFLQDVATIVGYEFENKLTHVVDPHNAAGIQMPAASANTSATTHDGISTKLLHDYVSTDKPYFFDGVGLAAHRPHDLLLAMVTAERTAYSDDIVRDDGEDNDKDDKQAEAERDARIAEGGGQPIVLLGCMQTRNGGRTCLSGSTTAIHDATLTSDSYSNKGVWSMLVRWLFTKDATAVVNNIAPDFAATDQHIAKDVSFTLSSPSKSDLACKHVAAELVVGWESMFLNATDLDQGACRVRIPANMAGEGRLTLSYKQPAWYSTPAVIHVTINQTFSEMELYIRFTSAALLLLAIFLR